MVATLSYRRQWGFLLAGVLLCTVGHRLRAAEIPSDRDQRWQYIKSLQYQLTGDAPKGENEIEFFAPVKAELHRAATEFAASAPDDPRRWEATLIELKTDVFPIPAAERRVMFQAHERLAAAIHDAPDAPPEIKQNAERSMIFQHLDHLDLLATPQQAAEMEQRVLAYLHEYPGDPKASSMQVRRVDLLARCDPTKVGPVLQELAASNDAKVASAARGRLAQWALMATPLDWKFTAVDGREVDFSQLRGRVILIDYWASWCPDCLRALPEVRAVYNRFHEQGLEIVGISVDSDQAALTSFTRKHGMPWPQQYDSKGWDTELAARYGVKGIPEMWLVGTDGKVAATGVQTDDLAGKVAALLRK